MTAEDFRNINKLYEDAYPRVERRLLQSGCPGRLLKDYFHDALITYLLKFRDESAQANPIGYIIIIALRKYLKDVRDHKTGTAIVNRKAQPLLFFDPGMASSLTARYYTKKMPSPCLELGGYLMEKLDYKEIAKRMNLKSAANVKDRVRYCRRKLKEMMAKEERDLELAGRV